MLRVHGGRNLAAALKLDQAADLRTMGFGWRMATPAFVERWNREHVELRARGYNVLWNKFGEMLVHFWPVEAQLREATSEPPFADATSPTFSRRAGVVAAADAVPSQPALPLAMPMAPRAIRTITAGEIEAARSTPHGGWTRATLAQWGVPWPPPKGWKRALQAGQPIPARAA